MEKNSFQSDKYVYQLKIKTYPNKKTYIPQARLIFSEEDNWFNLTYDGHMSSAEYEMSETDAKEAIFYHKNSIPQKIEYKRIP